MTLSTSWHSPGSIFNVGHRGCADLLAHPLIAEEKVDGSFFAFGVIAGELRIRSKGQQMPVDAPEKMFSFAAETAQRLAPILTPGWTYRGEYLRSPKHNTLAYNRVPDQRIILFDVLRGEEDYLSYAEKAVEAARVGLEVVPRLWEGSGLTHETLQVLLQTPSILGGQLVEGVVLKQRTVSLFGQDKKALMAKFVSTVFKEIHSAAWKQGNPTGGDILQTLGERVRTPARWNKAIQHLAEAGKLEGGPRDIGALIKEVPADIAKECREELLEALWKWAWPHIARASTRGLPEWYKERLVASAFEAEEPE